MSNDGGVAGLSWAGLGWAGEGQGAEFWLTRGGAGVAGGGGGQKIASFMLI